jgi:predicted PurR-regulated permease PerM
VHAFDSRTFRVLLTITAFAAGAAIVYAGRHTFLLFLFALLFAYVLEPAITHVERRVGMSRLRAIAVLYLILFLVLGGLITLAVPRVVEEGRRLVVAFPGLLEQVGSGEIAHRLGERHGWSETTQITLERWLTDHRQNIIVVLNALEARAAAGSANIGWAALTPILAFFFLRDKRSIGEAVLDLFEDDQAREWVARMLADLDLMLAQFIRAQLTLALLSAVAYTTFLLTARFPYGVALGVMGGVLEFIPFVGWLVTATVLVTIAFLTSYPHWIALLVFIGVWRLTQDYVNMPYVMGRGLKLHPLAAIFGVLVGGEIAGVPGVFLSIPIIATLRIVWKNWQERRRMTGVSRSPDRPVRRAASSNL